jgi:hypothetical protein
MARETECPVCNAYVPVDPDLKEGDDLYCSFCMARLRITREMIEEDENKPRKVEVEEDWE